ncbi:unnamed protein product [Euphydryas editha]|uniref:Uncharacterized protein n=1 Tax=Euphydryas editha TaxID=104508 RepID=A0AAU9V769_EUPED|nr:unnamed protein product [Euphydryas editha]
MDIQRFVIMILVAVNLFAEGQQPRIEVYEIRKRIHELLNGDQYNDRKIISHVRDANYKENDKVNDLLQNLLRMSDRSYEDEDSEQEEFEDKTRNDLLQNLLRMSDRSYEDDDSEQEEFEDKTRNGLLQNLLRMSDRSYEDDDSEQEEFEDKTRNDLLQNLLRMSDRSYEDDDSEQEEFEDKTRSLPIILISDDKVNKRIPQTENTVQELLQSALQSGFNG